MSYWIFQADPKRYRLLDALAELDEILWEVNQHAREIHTGDSVLIWQAGANAGIYALAEVASEPASVTDFDPHWTETERDRIAESRPRVRLKISDRLLDRPLLRSELRDDPALPSLSILKFAQGTNFPVSQEEWGRLLELMDVEPESAEDMPHDAALDVAETHLRQALARNLSQIEPGLSPMFAERVEEYPVPGGRIDLLCKDSTETPVVIELKRQHWDSDKAIGQIARYMGWAKKTLTEDGRVRGILLILDQGDVSQRLEDAVEAVAGLEVKRYSISIKMA